MPNSKELSTAQKLVGDFCVVGGIPQIINKVGGLHGHQVHSTVTAIQIPDYSSAPEGVLDIWIIQR